jgi:hypothetical protein
MKRTHTRREEEGTYDCAIDIVQYVERSEELVFGREARAEGTGTRIRRRMELGWEGEDNEQ